MTTERKHRTMVLDRDWQSLSLKEWSLGLGGSSVERLPGFHTILVPIPGCEYPGAGVFA